MTCTVSYPKTALILLAFFLSLSVFAQQEHQKALKEVPQASKVILNRSKTPSFVQFKAGIRSVDEVVIPGLSDQLRLTKKRSVTDQIGQIHERYSQTYKGLEILGADYIFHKSNDQIKSANGHLVSGVEVNTTPDLSEAEALQIALAHIGASQYMWEEARNESFLKSERKNENASFYPTGKLAISSQHYDDANELQLVYQFDVYASDPIGRYTIEVNAHTGEVVNSYNRIHTSSATSSGVSLYNGVVEMAVDFDGTEYRLLEDTRADGIYTYDLNNGTDYFDATFFTDADGYFDDDPAGVSAHFGAQATYDYFLNNHGRSSFDGSGAAINSYVHYASGYFNAFWDGSRMTYGDGDGVSATALVCLDIVGHEITHAVTQYSAGLVYSYESGALNESFSDIFGQAIEFSTSPETASWNLGDEIYTDGVSMIRSMSNPNQEGQPDTYLGDYWYTGSGDNGGVHYNSGVQNFWFYLLVEGGVGTNDNGTSYNVSGIGLESAAAITYRNLTYYLTSTSQYVDARSGSELAAIDLFGIGSPEYEAVVEAWNAVGVPSATPLLAVADSLDFGSIPQGLTVNKDLKIFNQGNGLLTVNGISLNNATFSVADSTYTIGDLSSAVMDIQFSSFTLGDTSAVLQLYTNVDTVDVMLFATTLEPPVAVLDKDSLGEFLYVGDTSVQSITISNTGNSALEYDLIIRPKSDQIADFSILDFQAAKGAARSSFDYRNYEPAPIQKPAALPSQSFAGGQSRLFATTYGDNLLQELDPYTGAVIQSVTSPLALQGPDGLAFDGKWLYLISSFTSNAIFRLSPDDFSVQDTLQVDGMSSVDGLGISDGYLYASDYSLGDIYIIDLAAEDVVNVISPEFGIGGGISFGGSRNSVFVSDFGQVYEIDLDTGDSLAVSPYIGNIYGVGYSNSAELLFASSESEVFAYDPDTWELSHSFTLSGVSALAADETNTNALASVSSTDGIIPAGGAQELDIVFDARNALGGEYFQEMVINTNDPDNQVIKVPVYLVVEGAPVASISVDSVDFGDQFIGSNHPSAITLANSGTDDLLLELVLADSVFVIDTTSLTILPGEEFDLKVRFQPEEARFYELDLLIKSNDLDLDSIFVKLTGNGVEPPEIVVNPDSLGQALYVGDSTGQLLTIDNSSGQSPLYWQADIGFDLEETTLYKNAGKTQYYTGSQGRGRQASISHEEISALAGSKSIMAWIPYADVDQEYANTMNAISQYYTDYTVVESTTFNVANFTSQLSEADVLLIPEQEHAGVTSEFSALGSLARVELNDFVNGGGTIIVCGTGLSAPYALLSAAGLTDISIHVNHSSMNINITDSTHFLLEGVSGPTVQGQNATFAVTSTDPEMISLLEYNGSSSLMYKSFGRGFLAYIGYDFYDYDDDAARIIANAVVSSNGPGKWLTLETMVDTVAAGQSKDVPVSFNATGLYGGLYNANIRIASNDPINPELSVPVTLDVTGSPVLEWSVDSLDFGTVFTGQYDSLSLELSNSGTDDLLLEFVLMDSVFNVDSTPVTIIPEETALISIYFNPEEALVYDLNLLMKSNDADKDSVYINLRGQGLEPPAILVTPDSLGLSLNVGDSTGQVLTIDNSTGNSPLYWESSISFGLEETSLYQHNAEEVIYFTDAQGRGRQPMISHEEIAGLSGSKEIMAWIPYADVSQEYLNTLNAITQYFTDYTLTESSTFDPTSFTSQLGESDVLLIPEQENSGGSSQFSTLGAAIASELNEFVNGGGRIIMCGSSSSAPFALLSSAGLSNLAPYSSHTFNNINITDSTHFLLEGIGAGTVYGNDATYSVTSSDPEMVSLLELNGSSSLMYKSFGRGFITYLGYDFYDYDNDAARIIANAVANSNDVSQWLSLGVQSDTLDAGESQDISVIFNAVGLYGGAYNAKINIQSNDPENPLIKVPVFADVTGTPEKQLLIDSLYFGDVFVNYSDSISFTLSNQGTDDLIVNLLTTDSAFLSNIDSINLAPLEEYQVVVTFSPKEPGIFESGLVLSTNESENDSTWIDLIGRGLLPPVFELPQDSVGVHLLSGDSAVQSVLIDNTAGGSELTVSYDLASFSSEISSYKVSETFTSSQQSSLKPIRPQAFQSDIVQSNVLVVQEYSAWGLYLENFISATYGITPNVIAAAELGVIDLSNYDLIITTGDQYGNYYQQLSLHKDKLEEFVRAGGILQYQLATQGANVDLVGGAQMVYGNKEGSNLVVDSSHFITNALDNVLYGTSANHCYLTSLPTNAHVIVETYYSSDPTMVEYTLGNGLVLATGMTVEYLYSSGENSAPLQQRMLDYTLFYETSNWLSLVTESDTVSAGEVVDLDLVFNATGLYGGTYGADVLISSNDPERPTATLKVGLDVTGIPEKSLSRTSVDFGEVYVTYEDSLKLNIENTGTARLGIRMESSSGSFSLDLDTLSLAPTESSDITIYFTPDEAKSFVGELHLFSNEIENDFTVIDLYGVGVDPPVFSASPLSVADTLASFETGIHAITIQNTGGSELSWSVNAPLTLPETMTYRASQITAALGVYENGFETNNEGYATKSRITMNQINGLSGTTKIVAMTTYADLSTEYPNTLAAIAQYYDNYELVEFGTTNVTQLATYLSDADVLVIPEQELASDFTISEFGDAAKELLYQYISNGGNVVVCGGSNAGAFIASTNLMSISTSDQSVYDLLVVQDTSHYLAAGVDVMFDRRSATISFQPSENVEYVLSSEYDQPVVFNKPIGQGNLSYIGFDYYDYDQNMARIIANAVAASSLPDWYALSKNQGVITAGEKETINLILEPVDLAPGDYQAEITFHTNQPDGSSELFNVELQVIAAPQIEWSTDTIQFGPIFTGATTLASVGLSNTGTASLSAGYSIDSEVFSIVYQPENTAPGESDSLVIQYFPMEVGNDMDLLVVNSNDRNSPEVKIGLQGVSIAAPIVNLSQDTVEVTSIISESTTGTLMLSNLGADSLVFEVESANSWLTANQTEGVLNADSSESVIYTVNTLGLAIGEYVGELIIHSNDPQTPEISLIVELTIYGIPDIDLSTTAVNFADTDLGETTTTDLIIENTGSDTLKIISATIDGDVFAYEMEFESVLAGSSDTVTLSFTPEEFQQYSGTLTIVCNDVNETVNTIMLSGWAVGNEEPMLSQTEFEISENTSIGSVIGPLEVLNVDDDSVSLTITDSLLSISDQNQLLVNGVLNYEELSEIEASVTIQYGDTTATEIITVTILDVNEAPVISDQSFEVIEKTANGTSVGQLTAIDPEGSQLYFENIEDSNLFTVSLTGIIRVLDSSLLDYDQITQEVLSIVATDGINYDTANVTVNILESLDSTNTAPVIDDQVFSIEENVSVGTSVGYVMASDPNEQDTLEYSIASGNVAQTFAINSSTGELLINVTDSLDYEQIISFDLVVEVSDGHSTSIGNVSIQVQDVNEIPIFNNQEFEVEERTVNGTIIGQLVANDPEGSSLFFEELVNNGLFSVTLNGTLKVLDSTKLDFESISQESFEVVVTDGLNYDTALVTVVLLDVNDPPLIEDQSFTVEENVNDGYSIGTLVATDSDLSDVLEYTIISGNVENTYSLEASSGELTVADGGLIDFETTQSMELVVQVSDGMETDQATITLIIEDVDEEVLSADGIREITVYPNPLIGNKLQVVNIAPIESVEIYDSTGKMVYDLAGNNEKHLILNIQYQKSGVYLLKITDLSGNHFRRLVIK
ncbi:choice-of-anchor D domain-containing protein [Marinoscillum sp.]|uniref:Ig-like domain-containing protein n=1 Tax=Marinoscillum sp. TaxID=2024838 RepID=UPI003BAB93AA